MAKNKDKEPASAHSETSSPQPVSTPPPVPTAAAPESTPESEYAAFQAKLAAKGITLTSKSFKSLGLDVIVNVPTSVEDFDVLAEKSGEALEQAIKNIVYRGALAVFRDRLCTALEAKTGIARKFIQAKNADGSDKVDDKGQPVVEKWEAEAVYVKRVAGDNAEQYQSLANDISATLVFDPSAPEYKPAGPKVIAKVYLNTAIDIYSQGRAVAVINKLSTTLGVTALPYDETNKDSVVASLAALIKEDQRRKEEARKAAMVAEYVG